MENNMAAIGKFVIFNEGGFFYKYRLYANNGQALIISEAYKDRKACLGGIDTLKKNIDNLKLDYEKDKKGAWCFRLITQQGRPLAQSANYKTQKDAERAAGSFQKFALTDKIVDEDQTNSDDHYDVQIMEDSISPSSNGKFLILNEDKDYYYQLKANNGQVLCTSQAYLSEKSARDAMENFRKNVYEGNFYIFIDKRKQAFFKLYSKQLRLVMTGETYKNKDLAISAAKSVLKFAKDAKVVS
jgi:uncharacterized protein YegP (UPF0339 family)